MDVKRFHHKKTFVTMMAMDVNSTSSGEYFAICTNIKSLCCRAEMNIIVVCQVYLNFKKTSPGWCGSVASVPACGQKRLWFDSHSGPVPGLQAGSPVGGVREVTNWCYSPSSSILSSLSLNKFKKKYIFFKKMKKARNTSF